MLDIHDQLYEWSTRRRIASAMESRIDTARDSARYFEVDGRPEVRAAHVTAGFVKVRGRWFGYRIESFPDEEHRVLVIGFYLVIEGRDARTALRERGVRTFGAAREAALKAAGYGARAAELLCSRRVLSDRVAAYEAGPEYHDDDVVGPRWLPTRASAEHRRGALRTAIGCLDDDLRWQSPAEMRHYGIEHPDERLTATERRNPHHYPRWDGRWGPEWKDDVERRGGFVGPVGDVPSNGPAKD
jgi:hypothetical protein